jgi:hypothetical protein
MNSRTHSTKNLFQVALSICIWSAAPVYADRPSCSLVQGALADVVAVRGLSSTEEVACSIGSRTDVERFLKELVSKKLPPQKLEYEGLVYGAIGIIPDDYPYETEIVDLYVGQIGGYYDPDTKRYAMADWMPQSLQTLIARHELTHALQDRRYGLTKFLDYQNESGDELLAHSSLIEGDATAVTTDIELKSSGRPPLRSRGSVAEILREQASTMGVSAQTTRTPPGLQALMLFPYTQGFSFVHALLRRGGYAEVDRAFQAPPQSSREILHPSLYVARKGAPNNPTLIELAAEADSRQPIYHDTIGEFGVDIVLRGGSAQQSARSRKGSEGWLGDRIGIFDVEKGEQLIVWLIHWERDVDAQEFVTTLRSVSTSRYGAAPSSERTRLSQSKAMSLRVEGSRVVARYWISSSNPK